jgi:GT2 family glycosyltransferase
VLPLEVLRQAENRGPSEARRRGVAHTTAPLIALLDADDIWLPDHLETLTAVLEDAGGIVTADAYRWAPGHGLRPGTFRHRYPVPAQDQLAALVRSNFVFVGSLFRRVDYDRVGGFREGREMTGAEDWDLWIRMVRSGVRVTPADHPTVVYRLSASGLTSGADVRAAYVNVLEAACREAASVAERAVTSKALAWVRARDHLGQAQAAARRGERRTVRQHAARAIRGGGARMAAEAVLLAVLPRLALRAGDRVRSRYW